MNTHPMITPEAQVAAHGTRFAMHRQALATSREDLVSAVVTGRKAGISEVRLAELAGVDRMTVRAWLGKPQKRRPRV